MTQKHCMHCKYAHKRWASKKVGGYIIDVGPGYYACHFLPYWGKHVETIGECPKLNKDGTEKEWSIRNACHVNK